MVVPIIYPYDCRFPKFSPPLMSCRGVEWLISVAALALLYQISEITQGVPLNRVFLFSNIQPGYYEVLLLKMPMLCGKVSELFQVNTGFLSGLAPCSGYTNGPASVQGWP